MKKSYIAIFTIALSLLGNSVWANNARVNNNVESNGTEEHHTASSTYYINAPRFVRPLIEKWITEYRKVDSLANFAIAKSAEARNNSRLNVLLNDGGTDTDLTTRSIYFAEYAILPVAGKGSEAAKSLSNQELSSKNIKTIFFENDDFEEANHKDKKLAQYVVYTGNSALSVSQKFASHYGKESSSFRGKRIVGDDLFLNTAIAKDPQGISINAISNIYDLNTRKLKPELTILPLNADKALRSAIADGGSIDDLLKAIEENRNDNIPVERVGFAYQEGDSKIANFIAWILINGEQYNHKYGLLKLDDKAVAQQAKKLESALTAQK